MQPWRAPGSEPASKYNGMAAEHWSMLLGQRLSFNTSWRAKRSWARAQAW